MSASRWDQGRVHPVAVVPALCAAAVVAGMGAFTAIALLRDHWGIESLPRLRGTVDPEDGSTGGT